MPRIAELRTAPLLGSTLADLLDGFGITDSDLPDIVPADLDFADEDELARAFPRLHAKLRLPPQHDESS